MGNPCLIHSPPCSHSAPNSNVTLAIPCLTGFISISRISPNLYQSCDQSVAPGPAASPSRGSLLGKQNLRSHPGPAELEFASNQPPWWCAQSSLGSPVFRTAVSWCLPIPPPPSFATGASSPPHPHFPAKLKCSIHLFLIHSSPAQFPPLSEFLPTSRSHLRRHFFPAALPEPPELHARGACLLCFHRPFSPPPTTTLLAYLSQLVCEFHREAPRLPWLFLHVSSTLGTV